MVGKANHIVQTLCFDTQAATQDAAQAFADRIKSMGIENWLDQVLSKYDHLPGTFRIDQLSIDVGNIDTNEFDGLEELLTEQLDELLANRFVHINTMEKTASLTGLQARETSMETTESETDILLHYLLTGSLPWQVNDKPDMEDILLEILAKEPATAKRLIGRQLNTTIVTERLATIFNLSTIELLAETISSKDEHAYIKKIIALLTKQLSPAAAISIEKELAAIILKALRESFKQQKEYSFLFVQALQGFLGKYTAQSLHSLLPAIEHFTLSATTSNSRHVYTSLLEKVQQLITGKESPVDGITQAIGESNQKPNSDSFKLPGAEAGKVSADKEVVTGEEDSKQYRYFIDNTGLVLLNAGLLQKYFEQLGWVKNKSIVDETAGHKMMVWLDWLVWGEHKVLEYGLLLNKILVGLDPSELCDIHVSLNEQEKMAGHEFLETINNHWRILKNTSIDGLRTTFLQRNGRLSNEDGGWQLHAEAKSYDILIDSLPWSFSIIKFPWMTKPLFTQWPTKI